MQIEIHDYDSIKSYLGEFSRVLAVAPRKCPLCGGRLKGHGRRWRWIASLEGIFRIPIQRMLCKGCRKTFSLIPLIIQAFRSCTRKLQERIRILWRKGETKMAAVRHLLLQACPAMILSLSTLYRWAGHTT